MKKEIKNDIADTSYPTYISDMALGGSGITANGSYSIGGTGITANGSYSIGAGTYTTGISIDLSGNKDFNEMRDRMADIEKRLAILVPSKDLHDRFPALQEAYDHYKLIERLVNDSVKIK